MKILKPNIEEKFVPILKQHLYIKITDFGSISFLKEVKIMPAQHTWEWLNFRTDKLLDLSEIDNKYCTFDHAINRSVNDPYCTVYEFEDWHDAIDNFYYIKYVDDIKTIYKSKEK